MEILACRPARSISVSRASSRGEISTMPVISDLLLRNDVLSI